MPDSAEDKEAIRELLHRYCFYMDRHLFADLGELFAPDGEWIAPYDHAVGPAAIEALLRRNVPVSPKRMHFTMNSVISLDEDRAEAESNYMVVLEGEGGLVPSVCGIYADVLTRKPGGWHFRRRQLIHHIKGEMALNKKV